MLTIHQLAVYPVKSLRGFRVDCAILTPQGLAHDRQWMIVNEANRFVTQRKYAQMILIHTRIENQQLILYKPSTPELPELTIHMDTVPDTSLIDVVVWKDTCQALDEGEAASQWLSKALNIPDKLRLVRIGNTPRPQSKPELLGEHTHTFFADAAPFLVTNDQSLCRLNTHLNHHDIASVTMEHFRPNIVLSGLDAFAEHQLGSITHFEYELQFCYPCQRCVVPTIDIASGVRHPQQQPFSLLAELNAMPENAKAPAFGENAILSRGEGKKIRVGDQLD